MSNDSATGDPGASRFIHPYPPGEGKSPSEEHFQSSLRAALERLKELENKVNDLEQKVNQPAKVGPGSEPVLWLGAVGAVINTAWASQFGSELEPEVMAAALVIVQAGVMSLSRFFVSPVHRQ